jgi:hypothetical protein
MSKTITQVKEWFTVLGIDINIKFNGKTLSINGNNFRIPKTDNIDTRIKFDEKIISYVRSLFPENLEDQLTKNYTQLSNDLKSQNIHIDFSRLNYGGTASRDIRNSVEDAKKLLQFVSENPDFYIIVDKYSAYRNLVDMGWEYITEE